MIKENSYSKIINGKIEEVNDAVKDCVEHLHVYDIADVKELKNLIELRNLLYKEYTNTLPIASLTL